MRIQPAGSVSRGFTLVELMAVSAIIAAVATLAIPRVQDSIEKAKVARAIGDIRSIASDLDAQDSLPDNLGGIGRAGLLDP